MTKEQLQKFWHDFQIPTQDGDTQFPYANPSDAARSLIKARNWVGMITEELLSISEASNTHSRELKAIKEALELLERVVLARCLKDNKVTATVTKNKEIQKAFILGNMSEEDAKQFSELEKRRIVLQQTLDKLEKQTSYLQTMLRTIDTSTEWIVQYVNWMKYESRAI